MKLRDRRDFDLPADLHGEEETGHFIPRKARSTDEIERRRLLRPGALVLFHEALGDAAIKKFMEVIEPEALTKPTKLKLASALFNQAWYDNARGAHELEWQEPVMRRRLKLPVVYRDPEEEPVSPVSLHQEAIEELDTTVEYADKYAYSFNRKSVTILNYQKMLSRSAGKVALIMGASTEINAIRNSLSRAEQQEAVMRGGIAVRAVAVGLEKHIGVIPSPAQLADFDSPLAVNLRVEGTNAELEALEQAMTEHTPTL